MKKMELQQMVTVYGGGKSCKDASNIAYVFGGLSLAFAVAGLTVATGGLAAIALGSQSLVFGGVGFLTDTVARISGC